MEEEIEQLKPILRSLVVSSPTQVDVRSLLRDYRNMIGTKMPLHKYGYNNPVDFLKEKFSDCFLFSGAPSNPVITLIVPETLKHIDKFVQKQKSSSTGKFNPKRRSVPEESVETNRDKDLSEINTYKQILSQPTELSKKPRERFYSRQLWFIKSHISANKPSIPSTPTVPHTDHTKHNGDTNVVNSRKVLENEDKTDSKADDTPIDGTDAVKKRLPLYQSEQHLDEESAEQCSKTLRDDTSGKHTSSSGNTTMAKQLERLQREIMELISDAPDGVWSGNGDTNVVNSRKVLENKDKTDSKADDHPIDGTDAVQKRLPLYQSEQHLDEESAEQCSKTLRDDTSGKHTSSSGNTTKAKQLERLKREIMELISDAPDGVWCSDLFELYKERHNRELNFIRFGYTSILSLVCRLEPHVLITRPDETGDWMLQERRGPLALSDDALPWTAFDPDVFPEDCMQLMESIESIGVSDLRRGANVEVMVGEVYSPSHFWFLRRGKNFHIAMEYMIEEMTQYYSTEGQNRVLAPGAVRVGHYCACEYEKGWYRALIVKVIDSDTVKVRHIDYGTVATLAAAALKPLKRSWAALPAQACRARLAAVRPPAAAWRWPHAAGAAFLALVAERRFVASVVDVRDDVAEVLLIDTETERDVRIDEELIRAGHADARPDSALHSLEAYLSPRFEALESGAAPNYAAVRAFLRDGIALEDVPEYRRHVPPPPRDGNSPDSSESITEAPSCSSTSFETCSSSDTESTSECGVKTSKTETEPASPPRPTERYLLPYASAYEPGAPYRSPPYSARPPEYSAASPCGSPATSPRPPGVTLSLDECETYRSLSHVNPVAAHWFIMGAIGRAAAVDSTPARFTGEVRRCSRK